MSERSRIDATAAALRTEERDSANSREELLPESADVGPREDADGSSASVAINESLREGSNENETVGERAEPEEDVGDFDEELYLVCNPDVAEAVENGAFESGLAHWKAHGAAETRRGSRPTIGNDEWHSGRPAEPDVDFEAIAANFDAAEYKFIYPDIEESFGDDVEACRRHWISLGRLEGRLGPGVQPFAYRKASLRKVLEKPFGLNVYGPFAAVSGLGTAARNLAAAIRASGIPYELRVVDVSKGPPRIAREAARRPGAYRANLILVNADQIQNFMNQHPRGHFDGHYNIAVWAWELASFRQDWFELFGAVDEVWSYSDFACAAIGASAPVPVHKMPLPIVVPAAASEAREKFGIPRDKFVFLTTFDAGSTSARKNPMAVLKAFRDAFADSDDAFLVIKFHGGVYEPKLARELGRGIAGLKNVLLIADRLSERDLASLQASADCFVSAHRSEGYGLNVAEFMALGKPAIATNYSGNLEFFDEKSGFPVDCRLVEIETQSGPYLPGFIWAEPSLDSLIEQMKRVVSDPREAARRGEAARRRAAEFSPAAIGERIKARLLDLDLDAPCPRFGEFLGRSSGAAAPSAIGGLCVEARRELRNLEYKPRLSVVVPVFNVAPDYLSRCVDSVLSQTYPYWELCLCDDCSTDEETVAALESYRGRDARIKIRRLSANSGISGATNGAAELATGEFLVFLDNDDALTPNALMETARALNADPSLDCLYSDEDKIDEKGKFVDHYMKPDWSPEHLESVMYVLHMLVVRKRLFLELGGLRTEFDGAQDFDLMLRVSRATEKIHHIARVLYHWRAIPGSAAAKVDAKPYALQAGRRALDEHVAIKYGASARVEAGLLPGTFRVRRPLDEDIPVTLLILTNNGEIELKGRGRVRLVDNFVDSIRARTSYRNYEIVVVDNSRLTAKQIERFRSEGVRVENYPDPVVPFNYAAKANFAVSRARTEHIVLLNDDMETIDEGWLTALMEFAQDPDIGGVGARLLHADGTLQHVGVAIGVNNGAAHVYHGFPEDFVGYNGFTHLVRNFSAVTGACFATRRSVLAQAGGFDEKFAIDFNDVDLCLRILECGYRIVYTPYALLHHFESVSAKRETQNREEVALFEGRWRKYIDNDPYYNVNLSRTRIDYAARDDTHSHS